MGGFVLKKRSMVEAGAEDVAKALEEPAQWLRVARDGKREGTVRLTLAVPRSLHKRLRVTAAVQEKTLVALVAGWIEERTAAA